MAIARVWGSRWPRRRICGYAIAMEAFAIKNDNARAATVGAVRRPRTKINALWLSNTDAPKFFHKRNGQ